MEIDMEERTSTQEMDGNHWNTLQELQNAIGDLPGVYDKIDAYMRAVAALKTPAKRSRHGAWSRT
ncbi:MAG: hypothetical protein MZV49_12105 [Rhodopseudomonas palustris]|nr:hypothetical protein [Rhodopseudomonas palustris]